MPLIPGGLPLKSGGAPETRGTRFPHIDQVNLVIKLLAVIAGGHRQQSSPAVIAGGHRRRSLLAVIASNRCQLG